MLVLHPQIAPRPGLRIPRDTRPAQQINTNSMAELATEGLSFSIYRPIILEETAAAISGRAHTPSLSAAYREGRLHCPTLRLL